MKPQKTFSELKVCQKRRRLEAGLPVEERDEVAPAACAEYSEPHVDIKDIVSDYQENMDNSDASSGSRLSNSQCDTTNASGVRDSNISKSDSAPADVDVECVISCPTLTGKCQNKCSLKLKRSLQEWANDEESIPNDCINRLLQKLHKDFPEVPKSSKGLVSSFLESGTPSRSSRSVYTLDDVMDMLHKVASKQIKLESGMKRITEQLEELEKLLLKTYKKMEYRSAASEQKLEHSGSGHSAFNEKSIPGPAKTMDELDVLVKHPGLPRALEGLVRVSISESVRRILKRLLARDLAMQCSFSGLGHRRQQSKIAFKDHTAMHIIFEVLAAGGFNDQKAIVVATQRGLRGACDWDGNRSHHRPNAGEAAGMAMTTTAVSSHSIFGPSICSVTDTASPATYVMGDTDVLESE